MKRVANVCSVLGLSAVIACGDDGGGGGNGTEPTSGASGDDGSPTGDDGGTSGPGPGTQTTDGGSPSGSQSTDTPGATDGSSSGNMSSGDATTTHGSSTGTPSDSSSAGGTTTSSGMGGGVQDCTNVPKVASLAVSPSHSCAVFQDGAVRCWGRNDRGQLGYDDTEYRGDEIGEIATLAPVDLGMSASQVVVGRNHSCALLADGTVKCWGGNQTGVVGAGHNAPIGTLPGDMAALEPVDLGTTGVDRLVGGPHHNCAIFVDREVKCWGHNGYGQLGLDDEEDRGNDPGEMAALPLLDLGSDVVSKLALGLHFTCAIIDGGAIKCWGENDYGQLGYDDRLNRGDDPGEMALLQPLELGSSPAVDVALGDYHACALFEDGTVKCWGVNDSGELGYGDITPRGDNPGEMAMLQAVYLGDTPSNPVSGLTAGFFNSCARFADGTAKCWGNNFSGQLGQGDTNHRGNNAGEMDVLGPIDLGNPAANPVDDLGVGYQYMCALFANDCVRCWGGNANGQLGYEDTETRGDGWGDMPMPYIGFSD